jgi:uncharacterized membrane protein
MIKRRNKQEALQDAGPKEFSSSSLRRRAKALAGARVIMLCAFVFSVFSTLVMHRLLAMHQVSQIEDVRHPSGS